MKLVQKLLSDVKQSQLKAYQASVQLHLKQIMTTINKNILQDMTQVKVRRVKCIVGCYDYHEHKQTDPELVMQRLQQLRTCKKKCEQQIQGVEKFLDNINFYSKKKLQNCSKGCASLINQQHYECMWQCHNRLDRRYKQYWTDQKGNIEAKFKI